MTRLVVDGTMRRVPNALNARRGGANGGLSDLVSAGEFFAMVAARAGIDAHSASALMTDYSSILGQDPDGGAAGGLAPDIALLKDGSIKDRKYTPDDVGLPSECPVCLCNFTVGQRVKVLPCQHAFCSACTNRWLGFSAREATCPLCRSQVKRATAKAGVEALPSQQPQQPSFALTPTPPSPPSRPGALASTMHRDERQLGGPTPASP